MPYDDYHEVCVWFINLSDNELFTILGWTGNDCSIVACEKDCSGNGYCNGTGRDIPECECFDVRSYLFCVNSKYVFLYRNQNARINVA